MGNSPYFSMIPLSIALDKACSISSATIANRSRYKSFLLQQSWFLSPFFVVRAYFLCQLHQRYMERNVIASSRLLIFRTFGKDNAAVSCVSFQHITASMYTIVISMLVK
jgi:hypothetical protein